MSRRERACPKCGEKVREVTQRVTSAADPIGDPIAVNWHCDSCGWDWKRDDGSWSPFSNEPNG